MLKKRLFFLRRYFQNKRVSNLSHTLNHSVQLTKRSVFFYIAMHYCLSQEYVSVLFLSGRG